MTINDNYPIFGESAKNTDKISFLPIVHYSTVTFTISQLSTAWQRGRPTALMPTATD